MLFLQLPTEFIQLPIFYLQLAFKVHNHILERLELLDVVRAYVEVVLEPLPFASRGGRYVSRWNLD